MLFFNNILIKNENKTTAMRIFLKFVCNFLENKFEWHIKDQGCQLEFFLGILRLILDNW